MDSGLGAGAVSNYAKLARSLSSAYHHHSSPVDAVMLDLNRLRNTRLRNRPLGQLFMANVILRGDYSFPRRTKIELQGYDEHLEAGKRYIFAMNHTDRFNYWPFQYELWRQGKGFTATWVKGKYYENALIGRFMDAMNNIPLPSRGYVLSSRFKAALGRPPDEQEYRILRDIVDGRRDPDAPLPADDAAGLRAFVGGATPARFVAEFEADFGAMIREVVRLSHQAVEVGNHLLIFPEGTRSVRLCKGRTGLAQIAQHVRIPIVPVGCNGSDRLYPGDSPSSKGGTVTYRVGAPITVDDPEIASHAVPSDILPFTRQADAFETSYEAITAVVMRRIAALLDPQHLPLDGLDGREVVGVRRFL
jgi:1-acyl-sn-glycerol-3-phosphate acyltransferase